MNLPRSNLSRRRAPSCQIILNEPTSAQSRGPASAAPAHERQRREAARLSAEMMLMTRPASAQLSTRTRSPPLSSISTKPEIPVAACRRADRTLPPASGGDCSFASLGRVRDELQLFLVAPAQSCPDFDLLHPWQLRVLSVKDQSLRQSLLGLSVRHLVLVQSVKGSKLRELIRVPIGALSCHHTLAAQHRQRMVT